MNHEFFFYSGLPRAGGTMLASVMNQHPDLYVGPLSPNIEMIYYTEKYFNEQSEAYKSFSESKAKNNVLSSLMPNYYAHIPKKYIMDNNRAWPNNIDMIQTYVTPNPKIVCIVRDVVEILSSFIDLIHRANTPGINFVDKDLIENGLKLTDENRCNHLMHPKSIVNQSLWSLNQAYVKGQEKYLHLVEYNDLINSPDETMNGIVNFLGLKPYNFQFNNIVNVTPVDDTTYQLEGMHSVRSSLKNRNLDPVKILGQKLVDKYSGLEFWRTKNKGHKYKIFGL
jgi:hypothetical protein